MNAGRLKYKIILNKVSFVQDLDYGSQTAVNTAVNVWADMKFIKAKERESGGIRQNVQDVVFMVRYCSTLADISERDNIVYNSITYDIQSLAFGGQSNMEYIEILAQSRT